MWVSEEGMRGVGVGRGYEGCGCRKRVRGALVSEEDEGCWCRKGIRGIMVSEDGTRGVGVGSG